MSYNTMWYDFRFIASTTAKNKQRPPVKYVKVSTVEFTVPFFLFSNISHRTMQCSVKAALAQYFFEEYVVTGSLHLREELLVFFLFFNGVNHRKQNDVISRYEIFLLYAFSLNNFKTIVIFI